MDPPPPCPHFPDLPALAGAVWSANIQRAHNTIQNAYRSAHNILRQDDADPLRLRFHADRLSNEISLLLIALERNTEQHLPNQWLQDAAYKLGSLIRQLKSAVEAANG